MLFFFFLFSQCVKQNACLQIDVFIHERERERVK